MYAPNVFASFALSVYLAIGLVGARYDGHATYYNPTNPETGEPGTGSCSEDGKTIRDEDLIVALSANGPFGNNEKCGEKIKVTYADEESGQTSDVIATVEDKCMGCGPNDIDLSLAAFQSIANTDLGNITVSWDFVNGEEERKRDFIPRGYRRYRG